MPLVTSKEMLRRARDGRYAVGAFNVENLEMVLGVIEAAEELRAPVILQTTPGTLSYATLDLFLTMARSAAGNAAVPVVMHLDHGSSFDLASRAYRSGYTSVMIDGSRLPFEENVDLTARVVEMCRAGGVPVEGELGKVGGKEDDTEDAGTAYTEPEEAAEFVSRTEVDSLAVGIGTSHGIYAGEPQVRVELVAKIRDAVPVPLVMHGTSGVPDSQVEACIRLGICKVNYATDLRLVWTKTVRKYLKENPVAYDPKKYGRAARLAVKNTVKEKISLLGCAGKAYA